MTDLGPYIELLPLFFILLPGLLWMRLRRYPFRETLRLEPISGRTALWSALIGFVCYPVVADLIGLIGLGLSLIGPTAPLPAPSNGLQTVASIVGLIIIAPLTEEPIFRGFVLTAWLRRGILPGLLLSAFFFACIHGQIVTLLPFALGGVVSAFLVQRTGSLYSSIIEHACYNAWGVLFILFPEPAEIWGWPFVIAGCVGLPLAWLLLRAFARRHPPLPQTLPAESTPRVWVILSLLLVVLLFALLAFADIVARLSRTVGT